MANLTLYYKLGACSLADNIILAYAKEKTGLVYKLVRVDLAKHQLENGDDYYQINPRGAVPALVIETNGQKVILTQNHATLLYIGDHSGIPAFSPAKGSLERARLDEALGFCSDVHAAFSPLIHPDALGLTKESLAGFYKKAEKRLRELENWLPEGTYWLGEEFTQADAYMAVVLSWSKMINIDLTPYPKAMALKKKVFALPAAKAAMALERR